MFSRSLIAGGLFALLAVATPANGARVRFYTTRSCDGAPSEDYQNVGCNSCIDPPGDWYAALITDIGNTRWSSHNQNKCTSASQVGQGYGPACNTAGGTAIRSIYIAC